MFQVLILDSHSKSRDEIIFEGTAASVILPGVDPASDKDNVFEILDFHKPIITALKKGAIVVDNEKEFIIQGGVAKMSHQRLVAVVDV